MRLLIFGKTGQVAHALTAIERPPGWTVAALDRAECDLAVAGALSKAVAAFRPDIVVNAAAYTAVDKAETEPALARAVNEDAPGEIAQAAAATGARLIHISTDYVFDGKKAGAYGETDECRPLSVYGATKLGGEAAVRRNLPRHVILRTSWVFSPYGKNFVRTMLRLGETRTEISVVDDQIGGPTAAADIAGAIFKIVRGIVDGKDAWGTYHYAGQPAVSWHDFAASIFRQAAPLGFKAPASLRRIASVDYQTAAARPLNSRLDCSAILKDWGIAQPSWEDSLGRCLDTLAREHQKERLES